MNNKPLETATISQKDVVDTMKALLYGYSGYDLSEKQKEGIFAFASELTGLSEDTLAEMANRPEPRWVKTDDFQYLRAKGNGVFELIEANYCDGKYAISEAEEVDINNYLNADGSYTEEASSIIKAYYHDDGDFNASWGDRGMRTHPGALHGDRGIP